MAFLFGLPIFVLVLLLVLSLKSFGINQEYQRGVLFRLGRLGAMKGPGWYWLIPFVDRVVQRRPCASSPTSSKRRRRSHATALPFESMPSSGSGQNSPVQVVTSVEDWKAATVQAAETALRDAIGQSELDHMLKDRARSTSGCSSCFARHRSNGASKSIRSRSRMSTSPSRCSGRSPRKPKRSARNAPVSSVPKANRKLLRSSLRRRKRSAARRARSSSGGCRL